MVTTAVIAISALQAPAFSQTRPAAAPASTRPSFDISPQPLSQALVRFSTASGVQVFVNAGIVRGINSPGASGTLPPAAALSRLLTGTGLTYRFTNANTVAIEGPGATAAGALPPGAIPLDTIDVQGAGNPNALIGNLPPEYPGGQVARGGQVGVLGNRDIMNTPFSQTNYTSKTIENQQARSIGDVLNNDPSVSTYNTSTGHSGFIIRGFSVCNCDVLFNGLRGIAPASGDSVMVESFERIEVLKGPSSLLNGMVGNVGGVINVVPKRAGDEPLTQITPDYTMNSQFGGHVDIGRRFGQNKEFGVRFNGVYRDGNTPINHQSREQQLATLGLDYRGERLRLAADLGYQKQYVQGLRRITRLAAGVPVPAAPNNRTNWFDPSEFSDAAVYYGTVRGEYDLTDKWTAFLAVGGSDREHIKFTANRTIINPQGGLAAGNLTLGGLEKVNQTTLEGGLRGQFDTGPIRHQVVLAYTTFNEGYKYNPGSANYPFPVSNIYNPVYGPPPDLSLMPGFDSVRKSSDQTLSSMVLADTLSVLDERVQLTVGARLQEIKATNFDFVTGAVTTSFDQSAVTPSVGLVVKPWQNVSLYANYIQGLQRGPIAPQGTANAGQAFSPYEAEQYEAGVKVDLGTLGATLAFYQIALPNSYTDPATNVFGINGEQRNRGADFNVFGEFTSGFRILGGISYIDSVLLNTVGGIDDGNRGTGVPLWRGVLGAEWDTPFIPGFTLTGRVIRNGAVYVDTANTQSVPAWTRLDIGARYRIERPGGQPIIIRAGVENVLNSNYWEATDRLILSEPRTFKLSASFNF